MEKYIFTEAKKLILPICKAAAAGEFDTREKFLALLEANPDIAAQDYNAFGKIFFWNQASAQLYGYSEAAAFNKDLFELVIPPGMRQLARDMILTGSKTGKMPSFLGTSCSGGTRGALPNSTASMSVSRRSWCDFSPRSP